MSKKKNKLGEHEVIIHGSVNGWLKMVDKDGAEFIFKPEHHKNGDAPENYFIIGKYDMVEEVS